MQMLIPILTFVAGASTGSGTSAETKGKAKQRDDIFLPSSLLSTAHLLSDREFKCQEKLQNGIQRCFLPYGQGFHSASVLFLKRMVLWIAFFA